MAAHAHTSDAIVGLQGHRAYVLRVTDQLSCRVVDRVFVIASRLELVGIHLDVVLQILRVLHRTDQRVGAPIEHHLQSAPAHFSFMQKRSSCKGQTAQQLNAEDKDRRAPDERFVLHALKTLSALSRYPRPRRFSTVGLSAASRNLRRRLDTCASITLE